MVENNQNTNNDGGPWWKPAVGLFSQVSTWVVVPIVLALIVGKYLDSRFDTKPWIFLVLTGIAFIFSIFGIVRVVTKYIKKISDEADKNKDLNNKSQ